MSTPAAQDDALPVGGKCALTPQVLLKFAQDAESWARDLESLKETASDAGEKYPDNPLQACAAPVSSRCTDA